MDPGEKPKKVRRMIYVVLRVLAIPYLAIVVLMYFLQEWLIFPGRDSQGTTRAQVSAPAGAELLRLKTDAGQAVVALFGAALDADGQPLPDAATRPTFLYCYGNAMYLRECLYAFDDFRHLGVNVVIPEYVGFGMSEGSAGEEGCYAAAEAAWRHLRERKDVDPAKIVIAGWSLGSGVAIDLASRHPEAAGLATFSAFTRMSEVAGRSYPWLPVSLLLKHRFDSERKLATITCPVFLAHGDEDEVIPFEMMDRLARTAKGKVTRFVVEKGDHNGIFEFGGLRLRGALADFLAGIGK